MNNMKLIDADALIDDMMERYCKECNNRRGIKNGKYRIIYEIGEAPCRACEVDDVKAELEEAPTVDVVERKKGKWTEKEVIHKDEAKNIVEEWQSCRCSVCGRYHLQPYMYYFDNPNYCSFCGADMRKDTEDATD